ncbi:hypothetical protein [Gramella sp. MAR_2010_147]|uniref:hypothetical protein n=1 Tax=Gramella sp. MAR_2010_147 TaxID=1250205 RepID=UPI0012FD4EF2|nr:hypothetical protein [Gramella sp. MAR_2010_147]
MFTFKKSIFIVLILIGFSACFSNRLMERNPDLKIVSNNVEYELLVVSQNNQMNSYGLIFNESSKNTSTGEFGKLYLATLEIRNKSKEVKSVDLKNILLCDKNKNCLPPVRFDIKSAIDAHAKEILTLDAGEKKGREIYYAGSKSFFPGFLLLKDSGDFVEFEYKK